jgi:hypothetical protein
MAARLKRDRIGRICGWAVAGSLSLGSAGPVQAQAQCPPQSRYEARVDLFFGAGRVDVRQWRRFLARVVTPSFPDGLTVVTGFGQWRSAHAIEAEPTRVLIIYYAPGPQSDAKIEAIRSAYKAQFRQMSVLRSDTWACVSF